MTSLAGEPDVPPAADVVSTKKQGAWPAVDSASLLKGRREVHIAHGNCIYTLRLTRGDKLILTK